MVITKKNVRTITDMRERTSKLLKEVRSSGGPVYIFNRSDPQAVLLNVDEFKDLVDQLEDARDTLALEESIETSDGDFTDFAEFDRQRRKELRLNVQSKTRQKSSKEAVTL